MANDILTENLLEALKPSKETMDDYRKKEDELSDILLIASRRKK